MYRPEWMAALALLIAAPTAVANGFVVPPYVQHVTADGATVLWETAAAVTAELSHGPTPDCALTARSEEKDRMHRVRLEGLAPGGTWYYRVTAGADTREGRFRTAPADGGPATFLLLGGTADWDTDLWERTGMAEHAAQWEPDFCLHLGNLVKNGRQASEWPPHFRRFASTLSRTWMVPVRGTGEGRRTIDTTTVSTRERPKDMQAFMRAAAEQRAARQVRVEQEDGFDRYFELPGEADGHAVFDWGDTHFVTIPWDGAAVAGSWLAEHLAGVDAANVVVAQHVPLYCAGVLSSVDAQRAEGPIGLGTVQAAIQEHGVLLSLSAQAHTYERSQALRQGLRDDRHGVTYLNLGGTARGGFPEWFTAAGGLDLVAPVYTVVRLEAGGGWLRTFSWDADAGAPVEQDYRVFWREEAAPRALLEKLDGLAGQALLDAVEQLGAMAWAPAAPTLLALLEAEDAALRQCAARALRRTGAAEVSGALLDYARDPDPVVRREAARAVEVALDQAYCHAAGAVVLDGAADPLVRSSLLGALAAHAPFYYALDLAERVLRQPDAPTVVRERAAWVADRVATRDDVDTLLSLVLAEREMYPLLRLGHALDRVCDAQTDLAGDGALAASERGAGREVFLKAWKSAFDDLLMRETQQEKRQALEERQRRWRPLSRVTE